MSITSFPAALDDFENPTPADLLSTLDVLHTMEHSLINDAMAAVQRMFVAMENIVNVMGLGAVHNGSAATNAAALNAARAQIVATGRPGIVYVPIGVTLPVSTNTVLGATDVSWGGGGKIKTTTVGSLASVGYLITMPVGATRWNVDDLQFEGPDNGIVAIKATSATEFRINKCTTTNCTLIRTNPDIAIYGTMNTAEVGGNVCRGFSITNNVCRNTTTPTTNFGCILILYVFDGIISGNRIYGHYQGLQYWGGNANPAGDGAAANERKCGRLSISGNLAFNNVEGGIWGSMGQYILMNNNVIDGAGDVALDFEGSNHCVATGNVVKGATNHALTTFFECQNVTFDANPCTTSILNGGMARIVNGSGLPTVKGVKFINNTFECTNGMGSVLLESAETFTFSGNHCRNTALISAGGFINNQFRSTIENNEFIFTTVASTSFAAIFTGYNNLNGRLIVRNNTITSTVTQPATATADFPLGSTAIVNSQFDDNNPALVRIEGNEVGPGWSQSLESRWSGPGPGISPARVLIKDNITSLAPLVTDSGAIPSNTVKTGNRKYSDITLWP